MVKKEKKEKKKKRKVKRINGGRAYITLLDERKIDKQIRLLEEKYNPKVAEYEAAVKRLTEQRNKKLKREYGEHNFQYTVQKSKPLILPKKYIKLKKEIDILEEKLNKLNKINKTFGPPKSTVKRKYPKTDKTPKTPLQELRMKKYRINYKLNNPKYNASFNEKLELRKELAKIEEQEFLILKKMEDPELLKLRKQELAKLSK